MHEETLTVVRHHGHPTRVDQSEIRNRSLFHTLYLKAEQIFDRMITRKMMSTIMHAIALSRKITYRLEVISLSLSLSLSLILFLFSSEIISRETNCERMQPPILLRVLPRIIQRVNDTFIKCGATVNPAMDHSLRKMVKEREEACFAGHARVTSSDDYISAPTHQARDLPA